MFEFINALVKPLMQKTWNYNQYQNDVDAYVATKNPTNSAEVEYWVRQYDMRKTQNLWTN
jgi:hypothetical protein